MSGTRKTLLIFGAHPDDAEIGMGGTIKKHTAAGDRVILCDLTRAEMSSNGTVERRAREADAASAALGLAARTNLGLPDRGLFVREDAIAAVTREIRRWKPDVVFAPYWKDRHPDHIQSSLIAQEAIFNAKLRRCMPDTEAWTVARAYYYFINDIESPDIVIDVSDVYPSKLEALRAYRSQFELSAGDGVRTPLNQGYVERVEMRDRLLGQPLGAAFAEGFASKHPVLLERF